jgi:hypothetical protein
VGFTAILTHDATLHHQQTVVYDLVHTNYGDGYDKTSGIFSAPEKGLYVFSCTVMALGLDHMHIDIVKNDQWITTIYSSRFFWDQTSQTVVIPLEGGDKVWTRQAKDGKHLQGYGSLFSGYLVSINI